MSVYDARGRLPGEPVAIVDIGSNSVRLVAYEALTWSPTPTFNEKVLCGLGKGVATTGFLTEDSVAKALAALQRFRVLCRTMQIENVSALATAAVRDAANGPQFLELASARSAARSTCSTGSARRNCRRSACSSSIHEPDGVVGDLGGGSLELIDIGQGRVGRGVTLPLGGLSLMDVSERSPKKAARFVREALAKAKPLDQLEGRTFYAARRHVARACAAPHAPAPISAQRDAQFNVIPSRDALEFAKLVERIEADALPTLQPTRPRPHQLQLQLILNHDDYQYTHQYFDQYRNLNRAKYGY